MASLKRKPFQVFSSHWIARPLKLFGQKQEQIADAQTDLKIVLQDLYVHFMRMCKHLFTELCEYKLHATCNMQKICEMYAQFIFML